MKEQKYIDQLFEAAKEESPQLSFEEVAQRFEASLPVAAATSSTFGIKKLLYQFINLNTIIMISTGSLIITAFIGLLNPELPVENTMTPISEPQQITEKIAIAKEEQIPENELSITPISIPTVKERELTQATIQSPDISKKETKSLETPKRIIAPTKKITTVEKDWKEKESVEKKTKEPILSKHIEPSALPKTSSLLTVQSVGSKTVEGTAPIILEEQLNIEPIKVAPTKEAYVANEALIKLESTATEEDLVAFIAQLRDYGIKVKVSKKRVQDEIYKLNLRLTHRKGLHWDMKIRCFERLEFKVILKESEKRKKAEKIAYRVNSMEKFSKYLTMSEKGRSKHVFHKDTKSSRHKFSKEY